MNSPRRLLVSGLVVLICLSGYLGARASGVLSSRPTAVAVVDIQAVFESLKEKMQIEADIKDRLSGLSEQEEQKKKDLQALQSDLDILAPGSPSFLEKQDELERGAINLQSWRNFQNSKLNRERALYIERLYRKMVDAVGQTATDNGFDVVLVKEKPVDFSNAKPEALTTLIQLRKVLWAAEELDLTDQVIQKMNNEFSNMAQ